MEIGACTLHRPRDAGRDGDRPGHQDRQPRADRPQREGGPAVAHLRAGRRLRLHRARHRAWSSPGRWGWSATSGWATWPRSARSPASPHDVPDGRPCRGSPAMTTASGCAASAAFGQLADLSEGSRAAAPQGRALEQEKEKPSMMDIAGDPEAAAAPLPVPARGPGGRARARAEAGRATRTSPSTSPSSTATSRAPGDAGRAHPRGARPGLRILAYKSEAHGPGEEGHLPDGDRQREVPQAGGPGDRLAAGGRGHPPQGRHLEAEGHRDGGRRRRSPRASSWPRWSTRTPRPRTSDGGGLMAQVHPTAVVHPEAQLHDEVEVGPTRSSARR